jgi:hypothetical protein
MVSNYLIGLALYYEREARSIAMLYSPLLCLPPVWSVAAAVICGLRDVARCGEEGVGGKRGRGEREDNASQGDYNKVLVAMKKLAFCASAHCSVSTPLRSRWRLLSILTLSQMEKHFSKGKPVEGS